MIVITGAAGLIGSAVVRELNRQGRFDLILVDHLDVGDKWMNLRSLRYIDYFEKDHFREFIFSGLQGEFPVDQASFNWNKIEVIIHLGANSSTTEKDASHLMDNNYRYSIELALLARSYNIRMVYASSAATYGDGEDGFDDSLTEDLHKLRPLNAYGYSKHAFDLYLQHEGFAEIFAGIKYFNVYGPGEYHKGEMRSVVHKAFAQIRDTGRMQLFKSYRDDYKDGEQKRDFLYVKDAARMTVHLALQNKTAVGLFNAGSGIASTWLALGQAIFKAMDKDPQIDFVDMPDYLKPKYQYYTCAPIDRLRATGYDADVTPLEDAIIDYVKNYLTPGELHA